MKIFGGILLIIAGFIFGAFLKKLGRAFEDPFDIDWGIENEYDLFND